MTVDAAALRAERRDRVFTEMDRWGIEALLLGREGNIRYVTGAHRLWLAGMRQWAPSCVVVRRTEAVHLLSITDAGLPPEIPPDHLFPITWNPMNLLGAIVAIDGVADAAAIGLDGVTPLMRDLLAGMLPSAEIVPGDGAVPSARRIKTEAEVEQLRRAVAVAEAAVAAGAERADAAGEPAEVEGAVRRRAAELGSTAVSAPVEITPWSIQASTLVDGYEGLAARVTDDITDRVADLQGALVEACQPGRPIGSLLDAYEAVGGPPPPGIVARGTGVGAESPVLRASNGPLATPLEPGMVLAVRAAVGQEDEWPATTAVVAITERGPQALTGDG